MLLIIFMYAVLAATFTISKVALRYATPYFLIAFRMLVAGGAYLLFQGLYNKKKFFLKKKDIPSFLYVALFYVYLAFIPQFWAFQFLTSSKVVILFALTPFIVALFAYFLASEKLKGKQIIGMIIGFLGMVPILMTQDDFSSISTELFRISLPEIILLISVVSAAYAWFPLKKLTSKGYTLPMINGITMVVGGFGALITAFLLEGFCATHVFELKPFLFWTLLLALLANGVFYGMYGWLLKRYRFTLLSFAGAVSPLFGAFFGWYFLSESLSWHHATSLIFICFGLYLFYQEELKR